MGTEAGVAVPSDLRLLLSYPPTDGNDEDDDEYLVILMTIVSSCHLLPSLDWETGPGSYVRLICWRCCSGSEGQSGSGEDQESG